MPGLSAAFAHRMDYLIDRQAIVSENIANANTPGYIAHDLEFQRLVDTGNAPASTMATTNPHHLQGTANHRMTGHFEVDNHSLARNDGNTVKMDEQMLKLNEIQMNYRMVTELYQKQKQMQQLVVQNNN